MIKYVPQDVREPIGDGYKLIFHCVNDAGKMGSGVAKALYEKWPDVRNHYLFWARKNALTKEFMDLTFKLGEIQLVKVEPNIGVINLVGQRDIYNQNGVPPIRYEAIVSGLQKTKVLAEDLKATLHFPYLFGCDLAGGNWAIMEPILLKELEGFNLTGYDLFKKRGSYE